MFIAPEVHNQTSDLIKSMNVKGKWTFIDEATFRRLCAKPGASASRVIGIVPSGRLKEFESVKKHVGTLQHFHASIEKIDATKSFMRWSPQTLPMRF